MGGVQGKPRGTPVYFLRGALKTHPVGGVSCKLHDGNKTPSFFFNEESISPRRLGAFFFWKVIEIQVVSGLDGAAGAALAPQRASPAEGQDG